MSLNSIYRHYRKLLIYLDNVVIFVSSGYYGWWFVTKPAKF